MPQHLSPDDAALLDCLAEARQLVRAGLADQRTLDYLARWEPVGCEIVTRSLRDGKAA